MNLQALHTSIGTTSILIPTTFDFYVMCNINVASSDREVVNGTLVICLFDDASVDMRLYFSCMHSLSEKSAHTTIYTSEGEEIFQFHEHPSDDGKIKGRLVINNPFSHKMVDVILEFIISKLIIHARIYSCHIEYYSRAVIEQSSVVWKFSHFSRNASELGAITELMNL